MRLAYNMADLNQRLLPLTVSLPQSCSMRGNYRMIDYQLHTFDRAGIGHKSFVLGHAALECASVLFASLQHSHFVLLNNPLHYEFNLDWSALLLLSNQNGPVIYYEGNILVPPSMLEEVKNYPAEICFAVDSARPGTAESSSVISPERINVMSAGKFISENGKISSRFISLIKLGASALNYIVEQLTNQSYEGEIQFYKILHRACKHFTTAYIDAGGRPWLRIDTPQSWKNAREVAEKIIIS